MNTAEQLAYLEATNILKLQTAARLAGLKWKSGDPAYNKAGIIQKLQQNQAMLSACVATLQRMAQGGPVPARSNPFLDDIEAEKNSPPTPQPLPVPGQTETGESLSRVWEAIECLTLDGRRKALDSTVSALRDEFSRFSRRTLENLTGHNQAIEALKAEVKTLREALPIEFKIENKPPITVSGQHKSFPKLVRYLQVNRRVILTGSAGTGKSMAVKKAAEVLNVPFYLQTPVTMGHELIGHRDATGQFHESPLFQAFTKGGLILMDEADAALPDALLVANPIFDGNGFAMFGDGKIHQQHPDFYAVFNMNTDGNGANMQYAGRNRLDGATLARFGVRINWEIDPAIEAAMAGEFREWAIAVQAVRALMETRQILDVNATPRHTKTGAALLAAGCPREEVLNDVLNSGALSEVWKDVKALPAVSLFLRGF